MFVGNSFDIVSKIREILGVSVVRGHFSLFVGGLFFLFVIEVGCSWVFVHITLQSVGARRSDLHSIV